MKLLICIDDTDNLESRGTGSIAAEMTEIIEQKGWGCCSLISRHQLVLHKEVRYTSHNSSMCFGAEVKQECVESMIKNLTAYLAAEMAEGSDPGICVADIDELNRSIGLKTRLIEFGYRAKTEVLTKAAAYRLADDAGIYLKETGGTGDGIIGALAGVGLRLHGYDGEVKGGIGCFRAGERYRVSALLTHELITAVYTTEMEELGLDEEVLVSWKAKPVLHDGRPVLLVHRGPDTQSWLTLVKNEMRSFGEQRAVKPACENFRPDVPEEHVGGEAENCYNCAYRRWTENSFSCMLETYENKAVPIR